MTRTFATLLILAMGCAATAPPLPEMPDPHGVAFTQSRDLSLESARRAGLQVIEPQIEADPRERSRALALEAFERARVAYRDLDLALALQSLGEAQAAIEGRVATSEDVDLLYAIHAARGRAQLALGNEDDAQAALSAAISLRPALALDEVEFAPDVRERYNALRARAATTPKAALRIRATPVDAELSFDGVVVGHGETSVEALPGRHFVRADALGFEARIDPVAVEGPGELTVTLTLRPTSVGHLLAGLSSLADADARALSRAVATDMIVRFEDLGARVRAERLSLVDGSLRRTEVDRAGRSDDVIVGELLRALFPRPAPPEESSLLESPWFWSAIGVAVLAGVTTTVLLAAEPAPQVVVTPDAAHDP